MPYMSEDAQEVGEILDAVTTKLPQMITNILKTVYSEEAGRNVGRAVGTLYKELVASGIPTDMALKMATDYMISFKDLMGQMDFGNRRGPSRGAE
jgi:tetrahydromethanopterin S-methyltransferase subunit G